jgi:hypothetical protein
MKKNRRIPKKKKKYEIMGICDLMSETEDNLSFGVKVVIREASALV